MSKLIVLNGASSAGKTLTAQALAPLLGPDCVVTGLDEILERIRPFGPPGQGTWAALHQSTRVAWFQLTDGRFRLFQTLHREVVAHHHAGRAVILETALMEPRLLQDAAACFAPLNALFVGMKPPLAVSEQWEAARGDRPLGQARKHYDLVHAHETYDLILDPSQHSPDGCARAILRRLAEAPPDAFTRLLHARER